MTKRSIKLKRGDRLTLYTLGGTPQLTLEISAFSERDGIDFINTLVPMGSDPKTTVGYISHHPEEQT